MRNNLPHQSHLPRLDERAYSSLAMVHWTLTIEDRTTGWLDATFHRRIRELVLHASARQPLVCPVYCLMPDHMHLVWCGVAKDTRQLIAMRFFRRYLNLILKPAKLQHQAHDHVLDEAERETKKFETACAYVLENPVRAGLTATPADWKWIGCVVPGYPDLHPLHADFWEKFWRIHHALTAEVKQPPAQPRLV
jgi:putative transposase